MTNVKWKARTSTSVRQRVKKAAMLEETCWHSWHSCFISSSNNARPARLPARMLRGFVQNQPEVSSTSLMRQEIKKDCPISRQEESVSLYPAGVTISVKKHVIQISLLLAFPLTHAFVSVAPKYYTANWNHICAVRDSAGRDKCIVGFNYDTICSSVVGGDDGVSRTLSDTWLCLELSINNFYTGNGFRRLSQRSTVSTVLENFQFDGNTLNLYFLFHIFCKL